MVGEGEWSQQRDFPLLSEIVHKGSFHKISFRKSGHYSSAELPLWDALKVSYNQKRTHYLSVVTPINLLVTKPTQNIPVVWCTQQPTLARGEYVLDLPVANCSLLLICQAFHIFRLLCIACIPF